MSKKKIALSVVFFVLVITLTFFSVFRETNINVIISNLKQIKARFDVICSLLIILYFVVQGVYTKIILKSLNSDISLFKGIYYAIVEFFFSAITPSSTGGQPAEMFYMKKDGIPIRKSLIVLILNTIYFKLFMVVFAVFLLIFRSNLIFENGTLFQVLFFIGFLGDTLSIICCYLFSFKPMFFQKIVNVYVKVVNRFKKSARKKDANEIIENYQNEMVYVNNHKKEVLTGLFLTFIQRMCMFSIAYVIYVSFGLKGYSYFDLLCIQISVHMCIEFLPLPGGTGASEHLYNILFVGVYGATLASTGMILTRIFSFYLPLIIIMLIIIFVTKIYYMKKRVNNEKN